MNTIDTTLLPIERIVEDTIEQAASIEIGDVFITLDLIKAMQSRLAELRTELGEVAITKLKESGATKPGKAVKIGEMLRWAGCSKETKSRDLLATCEGMMKATGGDWQRFIDGLSTNAFKPGECRKICDESGMPELFEALFETKERWKLDEKGIEIGTLQEINLAFLK